MFCKPVQDRRMSPAMASKGSIYAAMQQDVMPTSRVLNGSTTTPGESDGRALTSGPRHDALPLNHRATPNSDDTSDPDAASNTSFDTGIAVSVLLAAVVVVVAAAAVNQQDDEWYH